MPSDEALMAAYADGDASAFNELFARYAPALLRVLRQDLWSPEEARDLVQQTFLNLHRARRDFDRSHKLRPWLFTIAYNLKREHLRTLRRRPRGSVELDPEDRALADEGGQDRADAARTLRLALPQLPADQSEVITLHWLGGLTFPEIGSVVGASTTAVKVRAHRGYQALRRLLGDEALGSVPAAATSGNRLDLPDIGPLDTSRSERGLR